MTNDWQKLYLESVKSRAVLEREIDELRRQVLEALTLKNDLAAMSAERDALKAEIDELKLELSGCENVKADLARLLNCEDEPRWNWIWLAVSTLVD